MSQETTYQPTRTQSEPARSLRLAARQAKSRIKSGFWATCKAEIDENLQKARKKGLNESKAGEYFKQKVTASLAGETRDEFYEKVKRMLLEEGEVSDAIGRLTDKEYYNTLGYEEKQRYNLALSEKYLRALERFRRECEFDVLDKNA